MSGHIFVSYSRDQDRYLKSLVKHLTEGGVQVWHDHETPTGARWDDTLRERIETCGALVVVMTPAAEKSAWVAREIRHAEVSGKPIMPILLAGSPFFVLGDVQYEDCTSGRMPSDDFVASLCALQDTQPTPRKRKHTRWIALAAGLVVAAAAAVWPLWLKDRPADVLPDGATKVIETGSDVRDVAFVGGLVATAGGNDHTVRLWRPDTGEQVRSLRGNGIAGVLAVHPDGKSFVGDELVLWDATTGTRVRDLDRSAQAIAFHPNGTLLLTGDFQHTVTMWDVATGKRLRTWPPDDIRDEPLPTSEVRSIVKAVAFTRDGTRFAVGDREGLVEVWDTASGAVVSRFSVPSDVLWMAFRPDGTLLLRGTEQPVRQYDSSTGTQLREFGVGTSAELSPDGQILALAREDNSAVELWNLTTGAVLTTLRGHRNAVESIAFGPDGRVLVTGDGTTVRVWKLP